MKLFKSFKQYVFTYLFDYYYKDNDTYKDLDPEGKDQGILERFINTCAEYFDHSIVPNIDNAVNLIDVDKTDDLYLNYLWDMLGQIPYAYGVLTNGEPYSEENYVRWLENTRKLYPKADARKALRYAIRLFQIRGTETFFKLLGSFYGLTIEIYDYGSPEEVDSDGMADLLIVSKYTQNLVHPDPNVKYPLETESGSKAVYGAWSYLGKEVDDITISSGRGMGWRLVNCNSCSKIRIVARVPYKQYHKMHDKGIPMTLDAAREIYVKIFNKYLPVDVALLEPSDDYFKMDMLPPPIIRPQRLTPGYIPMVQIPEEGPHKMSI